MADDATPELTNEPCILLACEAFEALSTHDGPRATAAPLGYRVEGMAGATGDRLAVNIDDPAGLIASVDVMAESADAVVLHVELTSKDVDPNCAGEDSIGFFRFDGGRCIAEAKLTITGLPFPDGEFGPVWACTAGGFDLVTVTITPRQQGRTVYARTEVQHGG